ncbi:small subunit ribosomal protein S16e [Strigomonas culicis]|uniref:Small subunit ribosomal protein S16e n=1 Tax=Strigomonas culicis TaxID=28005 RepID=S9V518_9TRYP|nr:small subunit ribosomal protein S16e [Strigomonas culicis]|eukprot:EPY35978.1 small subunit ribosomal protein S16e [Strigomonas culicis]
MFLSFSLLFFSFSTFKEISLIMADKKDFTLKQVQTFGKKKTAIAVATVTKAAQCNIRINGTPIQQILPETLRAKLLEAVKVVGAKYYSRLRIDVNVRGGGPVAQAYAARQAIAKGLVAYYQKYKNEIEKAALKERLIAYDKFLLVADPRRCEPKKWGRHSARSRFTKSYR